MFLIIIKNIIEIFIWLKIILDEHFIFLQNNIKNIVFIIYLYQSKTSILEIINF